MNQSDILFEPIQLGQTEIRNRIILAPMTRTSASSEGYATSEMASYYASFAQGGFGLIITEGTYIDELYSQCYLNQPGLANEQQAQSWKPIIDNVHKAGAKIFVQLEHAGALSQGNRFMTDNIAPSAILPKGEPLTFYGGRSEFSIPLEASVADLQVVIQGFVDAALQAQKIGFDGIEIHGANGYLLDQFLTDYTNLRTDQYGGSTANRLRLITEICMAIRAAVGNELTIGIRISQSKVNDYQYKWYNQEKDARIIFEQLGQIDLDYIHVTEYKAWMPAFDHAEPQSLAFLAKMYSKIPVIANGGLEHPLKAIELLKEHQVDGIALGKGALADHDWAFKVKYGKALSTFNQDAILRPDAKIKSFEF